MSCEALGDRDMGGRLAARYAPLHGDMLRHYDCYVARGRQWLCYVILGWEHLAACALSYYLLEIAEVRSPWPFGVLWVIQTGLALAIMLPSRRRAAMSRSPLQRQMDRIWSVFILLSWNVALLNVMAGQPVGAFLPVLATLSSFAFLLLASFLSARFLLAALVTFVTGGLIARWPAYGFLIYGAGWLVVLEGAGLLFYMRRSRWLVAEQAALTSETAGAASDRATHPGVGR